jgi:hypothetical protein
LQDTAPANRTVCGTLLARLSDFLPKVGAFQLVKLG